MADERLIALEVVTPARAVLKEKVKSVVLPGVEGQMGILPGHLPLLTALDFGQMIVDTNEGLRSFAVDGGFAEISRDQVTVLTEGCEGVSDIDVEHARQVLKQAEEELNALEKLSQDEDVEDDVMEHHRKMLRRARNRLVLGEESKK